MSRTRRDSIRWSVEGTRQFLGAAADLNDSSFSAASLLPGWTRAQVVAHVAANAVALRNLVHWAQSGEPTPMYSSPEQRAADINRGRTMRPEALDAWLTESAQALESAWNELREQDWLAEVVTAQGRSIPACEIPWLRAREVWVHLVDLDVGVSFADLPGDLLLALRADVLVKRGEVPDVVAPLADEVAWLTGRPHPLTEAPALPAWL
jgi:maleylpyruvate isomerase